MRWETAAVMAVVVCGLITIVIHDRDIYNNYHSEETLLVEASGQTLSSVVKGAVGKKLSPEDVMNAAKVSAKKVVLRAKKKAKEVSQKQLNHGKNKVVVLTKLAKIKAEMMVHAAKRMQKLGQKVHMKSIYNQTLTKGLAKASTAKTALKKTLPGKLKATAKEITGKGKIAAQKTINAAKKQLGLMMPTPKAVKPQPRPRPRPTARPGPRLDYNFKKLSPAAAVQQEIANMETRAARAVIKMKKVAMDSKERSAKRIAYIRNRTKTVVQKIRKVDKSAEKKANKLAAKQAIIKEAKDAAAGAIAHAAQEMKAAEKTNEGQIASVAKNMIEAAQGAMSKEKTLSKKVVGATKVAQTKEKKLGEKAVEAAKVAETKETAFSKRAVGAAKGTQKTEKTISKKAVEAAKSAQKKEKTLSKRLTKLKHTVKNVAKHAESQAKALPARKPVVKRKPKPESKPKPKPKDGAFTDSILGSFMKDKTAAAKQKKKKWLALKGTAKAAA